MPSDSYDEILRRARHELSDEERRRLAIELRADQQPDAGGGSIYDSMARRGLIGKLTTAPPDLSTNPVHMEGFGKDAE